MANVAQLVAHSAVYYALAGILMDSAYATENLKEYIAATA